MRTITLEILRHGPPHNQLLSPLTEYLALCENHGAVTIRVPFEHSQMWYRLSALSYQMGEEPRQFQIKDTADTMRDLLSEIPGLTADMNKRSDGTSNRQITHLRLILSASELALLPFELTRSPAGFPGAGQHMLLQSQARVCLTRETRRVADDFGEWPHSPKVLFVTSAPRGFASVPAQAHLLALRAALSPWVGPRGRLSDKEYEKRIGRHLVVLTNASVAAIEKECSQNEFTHIHFLVHGSEHEEAYERRFGLALNDPLSSDGRPDIVNGERIATALRVAQKFPTGNYSRPAVVTLASCDSANVGSVTGVGASVAHALHEAGIPLVVASQFPMSFGGSVRFVEEFYGQILWGSDPREVLVNLRRTLFSEFRQTHDWASLAIYASFPPEFDESLAAVQTTSARAAVDVALSHADRLIEEVGRGDSKEPKQASEDLIMINQALESVTAAQARFEALVETQPPRRAYIYGLMASTAKRIAALHGILRSSESFQQTNTDSVLAASRRSGEVAFLTASRDHYWQSFLADRGGYWAVVQYLSLALILRESRETEWGSEVERGQSPEALWQLAEVQSQWECAHSSLVRKQWALANLIELHVISPLLPNFRRDAVVAQIDRQIIEHAITLSETTSQDPFEVFSCRRQLLRYVNWYSQSFELPYLVRRFAMIALKNLPTPRS
jgi:hypothetical protein